MSKAAMPKRALSTNFTHQTLRRSLRAKKRLEWIQQIKGVLTTMSKPSFMKHPIGALAAIAIVIVSGAGVYAAMNWFNGNIKVTSDNSIIHIDVSQCKSGVFLAGIDATDKKDIQFKILGTPHIDAETLQKRLLADCEFTSVQEFYAKQGAGMTTGYQSSIVKSITDYTITLETFWAGTWADKTLSIKSDTSFYDQGTIVKSCDIKIGDTVIYTYELVPGERVESTNPMDGITSVKSVFKTQNDTKQTTGKGFYEDSNIQPLALYNQRNKK